MKSCHELITIFIKKKKKIPDAGKNIGEYFHPAGNPET